MWRGIEVHFSVSVDIVEFVKKTANTSQEQKME